jgi:uroporphyrinogen-III decarboxylase
MGATVKEMTSRERWLAVLHHLPVDRLPFWPKFDEAYAGIQVAPFCDKSLSALHRYVGSDPQVFGPNCVKPVYKRAHVQESQSEDCYRAEYQIGRGCLTYEEHFDRASASWHPVVYKVKQPPDMEWLTDLLIDTEWEFDPVAYAKAVAIKEATGDDGLVATVHGISPFMNWLQRDAGIQNGLYWMYDYPEQLNALLAAAQDCQLRKLEKVLAHAPYDVIYTEENTSTTFISPALFRRYSVPQLAPYGRMIAGAGKIHILHMCGKLKRLLPDIRQLPAVGIEAFTAPPVGDTRLTDWQADAPNLCVIGGTSAVLWLEPAATIIAQIEKDLDALPHQRGLVLTSGGVMPPACPPETIRQVREWISAYPVRM